MYQVKQNDYGDWITTYVDGISGVDALDIFITDESKVYFDYICIALEITYEKLLNKIIFKIADIASESKIDAIKYMRTITRCGLQESKEFVEAVMQNHQ